MSELKTEDKLAIIDESLHKAEIEQYRAKLSTDINAALKIDEPAVNQSHERLTAIITELKRQRSLLTKPPNLAAPIPLKRNRPARKK